ncbi:UNVERIFIED_CONTAM: hypothetical protein Sangu_0916100 [Sesamum angustifolium]|uniref:Uncharacterized protein n=1 Tax=Sesamum angustifolium TaxID=2727405 RepID=A0AAW2PEG1_9LAMI
MIQGVQKDRSGTHNPKYDKIDDQQKSREYKDRRPSGTHNPINDKSNDQQKSREYKDRRPSGSHNPKYDKSDDQQKNRGVITSLDVKNILQKGRLNLGMTSEAISVLLISHLCMTQITGVETPLTF